MTITRFSWRLRARREIAAILAALPKGATDKDKRRACRCPPLFSDLSHVRKMWAAERSLALGPRPKPKRPANIVNVFPDRVECDWCKGGKIWHVETGQRWDHRCLMCAAMRDRWEADEVTDWRAWQRWLDLIADNPGNDLLRLELADWLEENGWPSQGAIERAKAVVGVSS